jgi:conjugal transfer/type IV secretion protein DotA/TraY
MEQKATITKGQVFQYVFMPQVLPRLHDLILSGFKNLAFIIALIYQSVRILPASHPVFHPENRAKVTLQWVIGAAYKELTFTKNNIDKVLIFFFIAFGILLLAIQFFAMFLFLAVNPALASGSMPTTYSGFFRDPYLTGDYDGQDVAYRMLWAVFGVPELFKTGGTRSNFHEALHGIFQLYSIGLLVVAVIILCYYVFAVVAETAETGVPFGKRYNKVWAPIRLVMGIGLLIPIGYGLNSAQWITLYSAKFGSDFASRGWEVFSDRMNREFLRNPGERVGTPRTPDVTAFVSFMFTTMTCVKAYEIADQNKNTADRRRILPYVLNSTSATSTTAPPTLSAVSIDTLMENRRDVFIRFGEWAPEKHTSQVNGVMSFCGDIVIYAGEASEDGSRHIQGFYLQLVSDIWNGSYNIKATADNLALRNFPDGSGNPNAPEPAANFRDEAVNQIMDAIRPQIDRAVTLQANSARWAEDRTISKNLGWGGAGIWYNRIASLNGSLVTAVNNLPQAKQMPAILEYMRAEQAQENRSIPAQFRPSLSGNRQMQFNLEEDRNIGWVLSIAYNYWATGQASFGRLASHRGLTGNMFIDAINAVFGTQGLFAMCQNTDVHPLAQLSQLGKGLVEASIRNIALGIGFSAASILPLPFVGTAMSVGSSILMSVASITIVMGFILFYVLPFMPFLYFFFAVGGWIKGLFEAMVGVPLWALAHLKIDGEGLPGEAAMQGYYLIFEIFLRPILILFGLLASIVIFAASVKVLNEIYYLAVQNLSGHDPNATTMCGSIGGGSGPSFASNPMAFVRGPIDELFFTVVYAIIVYMIGMSCFKLIDLVPNNILRFMGTQVSTYNDKASDPAEGLIQRLSLGGGIVSRTITGSDGMLSNLTSAARSLTTGAVQAARGGGGGGGGGGGQNQ